MKSLRDILATSNWKALEKYCNELVASEMARNGAAMEGKRYYENDNGIRRKKRVDELLAGARRDRNPLRNADFRVSHNWHQLLVNQKASYMFTYPPMFDCGIDVINEKINAVLGEEFPRKVKNLAIDAANCGIAWLHCWVDSKGNFHYNTVPMEEIYPLYDGGLDPSMEYLLRIYDIRERDDSMVRKVEIWNEREALFFRKESTGSLEPDRCFDRGKYCWEHGMGEIPFVPFYNNRSHSGDLSMVKDLIDQYDLVVSGFANDLADIQEVIFVLRNYGGEDLNTFLSELKRYKAIKVEGDSLNAGGVETMSIEIPIEARVKFLEILKRQIFISGQGVDPDPAAFGNSSGVALKYLYSLLEIKAGLLETEFRSGFKTFLRLVLRYLNAPEDLPVIQIYTRNAIENDLEAAEIAQKSEGLISRETVLRNHPWVENLALERESLAHQTGSGTEKN